MAPFMEGRWGHGGVQKKKKNRDGEGGRERKSAASHRPLIVTIHHCVCHNTGRVERIGKLSVVALGLSAAVSTERGKGGMER